MFCDGLINLYSISSEYDYALSPYHHNSVDAVNYSYSEMKLPVDEISYTYTSLQFSMEITDSSIGKDQSHLMYTIYRKYHEKIPFSVHKYISNNMMAIEMLGKCVGSQNVRRRLKRQYIIGINITYKVADCLADILSCNIELEKFILCLSDVQNATAIFGAMKGMSSLTYFSISSCGITHEAKDSICDVLLNNHKLGELDLSYNYLPTNVFLKLQNVTHLVRLNIRCMHITDEAADGVATFLSHNVNLKEFDVSRNRLKSEGVIKIFKGIQNICTLNKLDISYNIITADLAADIIAAVLSQSNNLKQLYLVAVLMHSHGIEKIAKAIGHISLTVFDIKSNGIKSPAATTIASLLNSDTNLEY